MPRKQVDPIVGVVEYFETAPIDAAKAALEVAGAIVRRRGGIKAATAVKKAQKPRVGPGPAPATMGGD